MSQNYREIIIPKLTIKDLLEFIKKYNIPEDAELQSDSRWECGPTNCGAVSYNPVTKEIMFTTGTDGTEYEEDYSEAKGWILYAREETLAAIEEDRKEWRAEKIMKEIENGIIW